MTAITKSVNTANLTDGQYREVFGYPSTNISATATVKTGAGVLKRIIVNSTSSGTIKLYNAVSADASNVLNETLTPSAGSVIEFNTLFTTGLHVVIANTLNVTIVYG